MNFLTLRDYFPRPVRLEAEYRPVDDAGAPIGPWTQLFFAIPLYNTRKPVKFSQKVAVPPGRYEVRARRYGAEAADFDAKVNGASGSDSVVWLQLRAFLQGDSSFAKESTVAIRIRATQISQGSARKFSVISTRILPVWNGSTFVDEPTRNPLWAFAGIKTLLMAALGMAASAIVALHDFLVPLATGVDWTPVRDLLPAWAWPFILFAVFALISWFRRMTDRRQKQGL